MEDLNLDRTSETDVTARYYGQTPAPRLAFSETVSPERLFNPVPNFAALYCESRDVPVTHFEPTLFWETLYPHARALRVPLRILSPELFASDYDFIRQVGQVQSMIEYIEVENAFRRHVTHFSGFRRAFKLRVSTRQIRRIVASILGKA